MNCECLPGAHASVVLKEVETDTPRPILRLKMRSWTDGSNLQMMSVLQSIVKRHNFHLRLVSMLSCTKFDQSAFFLFTVPSFQLQVSVFVACGKQRLCQKGVVVFATVLSIKHTYGSPK